MDISGIIGTLTHFIGTPSKIKTPSNCLCYDHLHRNCWQWCFSPHPDLLRPVGVYSLILNIWLLWQIPHLRRMYHHKAISGWVDWDGWYPGGLRYRAPYSTNDNHTASQMQCLWLIQGGQMACHGVEKEPNCQSEIKLNPSSMLQFSASKLADLHKMCVQKKIPLATPQLTILQFPREPSWQIFTKWAQNDNFGFVKSSVKTGSLLTGQRYV